GEPCLRRVVKVRLRAAFVDAGRLGGAGEFERSRQLLQQFVRLQDRGPRRGFTRDSARRRLRVEVETRRLRGKAWAERRPHRPGEVRAATGGDQTRECGCDQTLPVETGRRAAERYGKRYGPARRRGADDALRRLRQPLRRLELKTNIGRMTSGSGSFRPSAVVRHLSSA